MQGYKTISKLKIYNRIARLYDILDLPFEKGRYVPLRKELWKGISGKVLDAGVGTGCNFPYYPKGCEVMGIDLSPAMLARAEMKKAKLGVDVTLREMNVMALDFADDTFDTIVSTFMFCVLDNQHQLPALKELNRVCKPDGTIHILEYDLPRSTFRRFVMKLWAPWVRWAYGAEFDRKTEQYLDDAGLELVEMRYLYEDIIKVLIIKPRTG